MPIERFFFDQDDDCHWYLVDASKRTEWFAWRDIPSDDERAWEPPEFARALGSGPENYTFTDPTPC